jgi:hypothetical protein
MRRAKRSRSRLFSIDGEGGLKVFELLLRFGFGEWEKIAEEMDSYPVSQMSGFCGTATILLCQSVCSRNLVFLPVLVASLPRTDELGSVCTRSSSV